MFLAIAPEWEKTLKDAGLDSFTALWELERDWVEEPNERRGGWSGVIKRRFKTDSGETTLFIKRQEGQNRRTWWRPFRGRPTYFLEYRFLRRHGDEFPQLVGWACYGEQRKAHRDRAVLATTGLTHYSDLNELAATASRETLKSLLPKIAAAILPLHLKRLQHGALYAVHIFVDERNGEVKLIDLERARFRPRRKAALSDLSQFIRRTPWLDRELLDIFLQPWEQRFPGISGQLPNPEKEKEDAP